MKISLLIFFALTSSTVLLAPVLGDDEVNSTSATLEKVEKEKGEEGEAEEEGKGDRKANEDVIPSPEPTAVITLQNGELARKGLEIDSEIRKRCQQTNYRSYIECLLRETKRKKRQCATGVCPGYQQCYGSLCIPVVQSQPCLGSGCIQIPQQQCSGFGCVFIGYNCLGNGCLQIGQTCYGVGCAPLTNCVGGSCGNIQQPINGTFVQNPSGNNPSIGNVVREEDVEGGGGGGGGGGEVGEAEGGRGIYDGPTAEDLSDLRKEIENIRDELRSVKEQNDRLIDITEKATTLILAGQNNKSGQSDAKRETVFMTHNLTTSIDISNYLNNTNVINIPKPEVRIEKSEAEDVGGGSERLRDADLKTEETRTHCCIVVRPKTCRTSSRAPYFVCGHRKYRTCGGHCSGKRVVHSHVKQGCAWNSSESCVSYHSTPYAPVYPGYPVSGYYPPVPGYYPVVGGPYYPTYAQPPMPMPIYPAPTVPIYGQPSMYPSGPNPYIPVEEPEEVEECEDCDTEVLVVNCDETTVECKTVEKRKNQLDENNVVEIDSNSETLRGDTSPLDLDPINADKNDITGSKNSRSNPLLALREIEKEAAAIKRSENQLAASLDMLQEAVELKRIENKVEEESEDKTETKSSTNIEPIDTATTPDSE